MYILPMEFVSIDLILNYEIRPPTQVIRGPQRRQHYTIFINGI